MGAAADTVPFAKKTLDTLLAKSPISLKVTFRQVTQGAELSLEDVFKTEYRMAVQFMQTEDFRTGVSAVLETRSRADPTGSRRTWPASPMPTSTASLRPCRVPFPSSICQRSRTRLAAATSMAPSEPTIGPRP